MNYNTTTLELPNVVIRVHRPELTEQELNRRMNAIHKAAADLLKDIERKR